MHNKFVGYLIKLNEHVNTNNKFNNFFLHCFISVMINLDGMHGCVILISLQIVSGDLSFTNLEIIFGAQLAKFLFWFT